MVCTKGEFNEAAGSDRLIGKTVYYKMFPSAADAVAYPDDDIQAVLCADGGNGDSRTKTAGPMDRAALAHACLLNFRESAKGFFAGSNANLLR